MATQEFWAPVAEKGVSLRTGIGHAAGLKRKDRRLVFGEAVRQTPRRSRTHIHTLR